MQISDDMVRAAKEAYYQKSGHVTDYGCMRAALEAALSAMWQDKPATLVYGNLLWRHLRAARNDFDGPDRSRIYDLIEKLRTEYPEECKVWDDRYDPKDANCPSPTQEGK